MNRYVALFILFLFIPRPAAAGPTFSTANPVVVTDDLAGPSWLAVQNQTFATTAGTGGTLTVDPNAANGQNCVNAPCKLADAMALAQPGNTIKLHCGTYDITSGLATQYAGVDGQGALNPIRLTYDPGYQNCVSANTAGNHVILRAAFTLQGGPPGIPTSTPMLAIKHRGWFVNGLVFQTRARTSNAIRVSAPIADVSEVSLEDNRIEIGVKNNHAECLVSCSAQFCQDRADYCLSAATGIDVSGSPNSIENIRVVGNTLVDLFPRLETDATGGFGISLALDTSNAYVASNRVIGDDAPGFAFSGWSGGIQVAGGPHDILLALLHELWVGDRLRTA